MAVGPAVLRSAGFSQLSCATELVIVTKDSNPSDNSAAEARFNTTAGLVFVSSSVTGWSLRASVVVNSNKDKDTASTGVVSLQVNDTVIGSAPFPWSPQAVHLCLALGAPLCVGRGCADRCKRQH